MPVEVQEVHHEVIVTVVTVMRTDVKVEVVTLDSIKEVRGTTSNRNSAVAWVELEGGVVHRRQVGDLVPHPRVDSSLCVIFL